MRYKAYSYETGRQLRTLEDYLFFRENGKFVPQEKDEKTFSLTSELADGIYTNYDLFFIPESHPFFNVDVITNAVDGYGQPPITSRKLIYKTWVKFTELTFTYIRKLVLAS
jgi:hypothetical protein